MRTYLPLALKGKKKKNKEKHVINNVVPFFWPEASTHCSFAEKPFIDIKEPWTKVWEVNEGDQLTTIPIKYSAYPDPNIKW